MLSSCVCLSCQKTSSPPTYWYIWERNFHSRGKVYIPANINRRSSINQRAVFLETCPPKYLLELSSFALLTGRLSVSLWTPPPPRQNDNLGLDKHLGGELPQWILSSSGVLLSFLGSAFLLKEQFTSSALCLLELGKKHNCPFVTIYCPFPGGSTEVYKEHSRSLLLSRAFWVHCFCPQLTTTYYFLELGTEALTRGGSTALDSFVSPRLGVHVDAGEMRMFPAHPSCWSPATLPSGALTSAFSPLEMLRLTS